MSLQVYLLLWDLDLAATTLPYILDLPLTPQILVRFRFFSPLPLGINGLDSERRSSEEVSGDCLLSDA